MKIAGFNTDDIRKLRSSDDKENSKRGFVALAVLIACIICLIYSVVDIILFFVTS